MASGKLKEKANFTRLSRLLIDKGTEALRNKFDTIHPPVSLPRVLAINKTSLQKLKPRVINNSQWDLLFPPSGNPPDSKTFDVTLLTVLFRNICGFPSTGWSEMPPDTDRSEQANITRIKCYRNEVYAHVTTTQVDNSKFESLWKKISQSIVELGVSQSDVDDLKKCPLGPKEVVYAQKLIDWKLHEDECIELLKAINETRDVANETRDVVIEIHQSLARRTLAIPADTNPKKKSHMESDEDLLRKLAKHNFKGQIKRKVNFFLPGTRKWLLNEISEWFQNCDSDSRIKLITAGPGFGKSVFSAKICEDFEKNGKLAACHFCDFSNSNLRDPMVMLESLASQMCKSVPGFKEELLDQLGRRHQVQNLRDAFLIYLQNPLNELEIKEPRLVVIDGLDESAADNKNEITHLIAEYFPDLPEYIKILVTSRPEISVADLRLRDDQKTDISNVDDNNNSDLELFFKKCFPSLVGREADESDMSRDIYEDHPYHHRVRQNRTICLLSIFVDKCQGSFLYAYHFQSGLRARYDLEKLTNNDVMEFLPEGLNSVYERYFKRLEDELSDIKHEKFDVLKILEMLAASEGPLPLIFVAQVFCLAPDCRETKDIINKINETVSCLLYVSDDMLTVFHKSVIDWLLARGYKDHQYTVKVDDGHRSLWLLCEKGFKEIVEGVRLGREVKFTNDVEYALKHGLKHLEKCGMEEGVFWFVDVIIICYMLTVINSRELRRFWLALLQCSWIKNEVLRARISYHVIEFESLHLVQALNHKMNQNYHQIYSTVVLQSYLQAVLTHSPEGYFSDDEKKIAETILSNLSPFFESNSYEVSVLPRAVWKTSGSDVIVLNRRLLRRRAVAFNGVQKTVRKRDDDDLSKRIRGVALSNDEKSVAVGIDHFIHVFSLPTLVEIMSYSTKLEKISCCTFSPDDSLILFGKLETAFNIAERKEVPFFPGNEETFETCAFSSNGKRLVTSDGSNTIKLWDVAKQTLLSFLCAGFRVGWCSFSITGLFIIANSEFSSCGDDNRFCVWNAITLQRSDKRKLSHGEREKSVVSLSWKCERCFQRRLEEPNPKKLEIKGSIFFHIKYMRMWFPWICKGVQCIFSSKEYCYSSDTDSIPLTAIVAWNYLVASSRHDSFYAIKLRALETNLWLFSSYLEEDDNNQSSSKLIVFKTLAPTQEQSGLSRPTEVYSSSFSPDGSRLASCNSDGYINVWNVYTNQVEQRFKSSQCGSRFLCWWSEDFLFVISEFNRISKLTRYPVDDNLEILFTHSQDEALYHLPTLFDRPFFRVGFSEGFVSLALGAFKPVKVLDVRDVDGPVMINLPGIQSLMEVEISPGGAFISGCNDHKCYIWKRNTEKPTSYEVFYQRYAGGRLPDVVSFSNDSKVAVVMDSRAEKSEIIDLNTGDSQNITPAFVSFYPLTRSFCIHKSRIVLTLSDHLIAFHDMDSGAILNTSYQRYLETLKPRQTIQLSPKEDVLAFPELKGDMVFLRLSIPPNHLLDDIKRGAVVDPFFNRNKLVLRKNV